MGNLFRRLNSSLAQTTPIPARSPNRPRPTSQNQQTTRPRPTASDVRSYIEELTELSEFLDKLDELTSGKFIPYEVAGEVLDLDDETMNSYLEALSVKADHLNGIHKLLQHHQDIAGADLLSVLLSDVEPKCRKMRDKLSRLRSTLITEASSKRDAASGEAQASDGSNRSGPSGLCGSASATAQTVIPQPSPTGSNHAGRYTTPSVASGLDLSISSDGEESESEEEEQEELGRRRSSAGQGQNMEAVEEWRKQNSTGDAKRLKVNRSNNLLDQVIPWYAATNLKTLRRILAVTFAGENGMDMGALTREFFFIVFEAVISGMFKSHRLMEGQRGHLIPNAMTDCRPFTSLGRLIVHAIINDCKGLHGLSPAIVHYLVSGKSLTQLEEIHPPVHIDDVADSHLKQLLQKYGNGEDFSATEEDAWMSWMAESNCRANWRSSASRQYVIQQLLLHYIFMKRILQIQALEEGFKTLGLQRFLMNNATKENICEVFPSNDSTAYSPDTITAIITTRGDYFDLNVYDLFKQFMQDLHDGNIANFRLCDLIQFVTSSPYLPERLVVSFSPDITIPVAHACYSEITLPLSHQTYRKFKEAMVTAFQNGLTGFQMQ